MEEAEYITLCLNITSGLLTLGVRMGMPKERDKYRPIINAVRPAEHDHLSVTPMMKLDFQFPTAACQCCRTEPAHSVASGYFLSAAGDMWNI